MPAPSAPKEVAYDKNHPFPAKIVENRIVSGPGSRNETRHFVLDLRGSGLRYTVGDSLGVYPTNHPMLVEEILAALGATGEETVRFERSGEVVSMPLREALLSRCAITQPTRRLLALLREVATAADDCERIDALLADEKARSDYLEQRELIDLFEEFPSARPEPQSLVDGLGRLNPRLYSIASSPLVHGAFVHLLVAVVRYETNNRNRFGVCSTFKADRVESGVTPVPVFVAPSRFGLPENDAADIIMIGPGTGVAPFRAFLQEREARRATGRNWLFFGGQRRSCDFLYGDEFLAAHETGLLTRLDLAFSRDQPRKVYVQDRLREQAGEVWRWIRGGAYVYVCGDAKHMARAVDEALRDIIAEQGEMSADEAAALLQTLRRERRYQRDVY